MPDEPALRSLRAAFDDEVESSPEDRAMLDRAVQGTMAALAAGALAATAVSASTSTSAAAVTVARGGGALKLVAPFVAGAVASLGAGALYLSMQSSPAPVPPAAIVAAQPVTPVTTPEEPAPVVEPQRAISVDELPKMPASRVEPLVAPPSAAPSASASELFRSANTARRSGDVDAAIAGYRALLTQYPAAGESSAAHVSLGMLLLDKKGDAQSALREFDAYLAGGSRDALAEEARLGRALAFQRLGRAQEERKAWHALIENHPKSLQRSRAEARLSALGESSR